jgi:putative flippase GtrA
LLPRVWVAFTAAFACLSLGPFVYIGGMNTYLPAPWAVLRYAPILNLARSPSRFAVVAALGLSLLFAFAVQELWRRRSTGSARVWAVLVAVALAIEMLPAPRPLYAAVVPQIYDLVATTAQHPDEAPRLLDLPTGVRDGTSSMGNFNPASPFFQTRHRRPVIGGYLSRVSKIRKLRNASDPMMWALTAISEGQPLSAERAENARVWRDTFLRRSCVRYVILDEDRAPAGMRDTAIDLLGLASVHRDGKYELFTPKDPPSCDPPERKRRRRLWP